MKDNNKQYTYSDGTPITAPFFLVTCKECGYESLHVMRNDSCPKCGAAAECVPANEVKKKTGLTVN